MNKNVKNIVTVCTFIILLLIFFVWGIIAPKKQVSDSERRPLSPLPKIESVVSATFSDDFESYATDHFPLRDNFRTLKSTWALYVYNQSDVNSLYLSNGYISKLEYPASSKSLTYAADKFRRIYEKYLCDKNVNVYLSVIPDKNRYTKSTGVHPSIDYDAFAADLRAKCDYAEYIDIYDCLTLDSYYKTDTHWRQERLTNVASVIAKKTGASISTQYDTNTVDTPFYGVYYGQLALPLSADKLCYLTNDTINNITVYDHEESREMSVYDMSKATSRDPYEMFLSGSKSLITLKNNNAENKKRLIIFRDSFASSIAPLLATGYSETVLIDIRYISSEILSDMVDFDNSDVLFLYSTLVLNNSITLK